MEEVQHGSIQRFAETAEEGSHLGQLSVQIDRYEKNIAALEGQLRPILIGDENEESEKAVMVSPPADHMLHMELRRLEDANHMIEHLRDRIRL